MPKAENYPGARGRKTRGESPPLGRVGKEGGIWEKADSDISEVEETARKTAWRDRRAGKKRTSHKKERGTFSLGGRGHARIAWCAAGVRREETSEINERGDPKVPRSLAKTNWGGEMNL